MGNSAQDSQMAWEFGEAFLDQFAGRIISDPSVALVELVANAFDAGAWQVSIIWPSDPYGYFAIEDNGVGMTTAQFEHRWRSWSYNRVREQGANIEYPANFPGPKLPRAAFGRNGQGRLGAFCFSSEYRIETWRDGECTIAQVTRSDATDQPFGYQILEVSRREGHGTIISTNAIKPESYIPESAVLNSVGSKFVVVPWLDILVNNSQVGLTDLSGLTTTSLNIPGMGEQIRIHTVEADRRDRTIALRGIAWWVNGRMVGEPSWGRFTHEGAFLDGRRQLAGSCSFIVEADVLKTDVKSDWTWFHDTPQSLAVEHAVDAFVSEKLRQFDGKRRKARKSAAVHESRQALRSMTSGRRLWVGRFIDAIMDQCPSLSDRDLARVVQVFSSMEASTSGFQLLERLAQCTPGDVDAWNSIMEDWTAAEVALVMDEIGRRVQLLRRLQPLVKNPEANELHEIHPLFARGLWMFGREFETRDFLSNRTLCTVIADLLKGEVHQQDHRRPDLVVLPESTVTVHADDAYNSDSEPDGLSKVLIIELKKGGSTIGEREYNQGQSYATALRRENVVQRDTEIVVYVLGARVDEVVGDGQMHDHRTFLYPRSYDTIIGAAQSRTFHLERRLEALSQSVTVDEEVEIAMTEQLLEMTPDTDLE